MIVAATVVVVPAIGRMTFLGTPPSLVVFMLVWPLPVYVAMLHDYVTKRLIHPAYVTGVLAMLAERLVLPFGRTETWSAMSAWFVPFYQCRHGGAPSVSNPPGRPRLTRPTFPPAKPPGNAL